MIKTAITVSLVEEARGGPFVFWDGIEDACQRASDLGFDAIELFAPSTEAVETRVLKDLLTRHHLQLAAVGTGAGWVKHKLQLCHPDAGHRTKAKEFIKRFITYGAQFQAPAIIGSMQGRSGDSVSKDQALSWLSEALDELGEFAGQHQVPLIYEPLNRYETNLCNTVADGVKLLKNLKTHNVRLLADLFHMNIEEANPAEAFRLGKDWIGHVHYVDSNRKAAGMGHLDLVSIAEAMKQTGYDGYASAEAFPLPDSATAASTTILSYRKLFG